MPNYSKDQTWPNHLQTAWGVTPYSKRHLWPVLWDFFFQVKWAGRSKRPVLEFRRLPWALFVLNIWIYKLFGKLKNLLFQEAISDTSSCVISSGDLLLNFVLKALGVLVVPCLRCGLTALHKNLDSKSKQVFSNSCMRKGRKFCL